MLRSLRSRRLFATNSSSPASNGANLPTSQPQHKAPRTGRRYKPDSLITQADAMKWADMNARQKVLYAGKQTSYTGVIILGVGVTGILLWSTFSELFGFGGDVEGRRVYKEAFRSIKDNEEVSEYLGSNLTEMALPSNARGRHAPTTTKPYNFMTSVDQQTQQKTGFMQFMVSGDKNDGTVNVWAKEMNAGKKDWATTNILLQVTARDIYSKDGGRNIVVKE